MDKKKPKVQSLTPKGGRKLFGALIHTVPELGQGLGISVPCLKKYEIWSMFGLSNEPDIYFECHEKKKYHVHIILEKSNQVYIVPTPIYSAMFLRQILIMLVEFKHVFEEVTQNLLVREEGRGYRKLEKNITSEERKIMKSKNFFKFATPLPLTEADD